MSTPIGTPIYMSPEHFTAPRRVDARSDVWSLGVILFEMLAGLPPFLGNTLPQIRVQVLRGLYPRLSAMRDDIPTIIDRTLAGALTRDPRDRIPTVATFAALLAPLRTAASRARGDTDVSTVVRPGAPQRPASAPLPCFPMSTLAGMTITPAAAAPWIAPPARRRMPRWMR